MSRSGMPHRAPFSLPASLLDESVLLDVIEYLPAGVFAKDQDNDFRFVIWNSEMERIFSTPREQMLGKNDYDFFAPAEADYYRGTDTAVMAGGEVVEILREEVTTARGAIIAHTIKVPVTLNDGRRILLGILEDITEAESNRRELEHYQTHLEALVESRTRELKQLASTDMLTGLSNRNHFTEVLGARIDADLPITLIYLELDRFKLVNDTYGHDFGDELLSIVGERLAGLSGAVLNVARIGGDEFAILVDLAVDAPELDALCLHISGLLQTPVVLEERQYTIDGSMGLCGFPQDASTPREMLQHADMAMYHAKRSRQSRRWERFSHKLHALSRQELLIEQELRIALSEGQLRVDYQPQYSASAPATMIGMEALVRWTSPVLGHVPPGDFIPISEITGVVHQITDFVLDTVCRDIQAALRQGIALPRVSINISAAELDAHTGQRIEAALARHQISPGRLTLEITENSKITGQQAVFDSLRPLRNRGLRVSIDDFGTGYSSLAYISELEIDEIKIDKSFVQSALDNPKHESIVKAIVGIGEAFGYAIVAEGVETPEQFAALRAYTNLAVQGFLFSRPQPFAQITGLTEAENSPGFALIA